MNPAHQIHRALLIFRRPLRVMLADNLGSVTQDVGAIPDGAACDQDLSRESMPKAMRLRVRHLFCKTPPRAFDRPS
jgi:hypothetical protein